MNESNFFDNLFLFLKRKNVTDDDIISFINENSNEVRKNKLYILKLMSNMVSYDKSGKKFYNENCYNNILMLNEFINEHMFDNEFLPELDVFLMFKMFFISKKTSKVYLGKVFSRNNEKTNNNDEFYYLNSEKYDKIERKIIEYLMEKKND